MLLLGESAVVNSLIGVNMYDLLGLEINEIFCTLPIYQAGSQNV